MVPPGPVTWSTWMTPRSSSSAPWLPTVQLLPSHRSFLRRAAKDSNALAGQGEGAPTTVNTSAPTSTDVASDLLTMLRNAVSTDASSALGYASFCSLKCSLRTWTLGWCPVTLKDIASWEIERRKEGALQTPHTLFRAKDLFRDWVPAFYEKAFTSNPPAPPGNGGGVHDERAPHAKCGPQSLHEHPQSDGKGQRRYGSKEMARWDGDTAVMCVTRYGF